MSLSVLKIMRVRPQRPQRPPREGFLSPQDKADLRDSIARVGLRTLPYPFGSAVAVVSDVDGSTRARYNGYVGSLTRELGLDFGDSTWLRWRYAPLDRDMPMGGDVFGFFSRHLNSGRAEPADSVEHTRTLFESVAEYHAGNVDHFHSYLSRGPRVSVLRDFKTVGKSVEAELGEFEERGPWNCSDVFIVAMCVVARTATPIRPRSAEIHDQGGVHRYRASRSETWPDGRERHFLVHTMLGDDSATTPELVTIRKVAVEFESAEDAANVEAIFLIDGYGPALLERLAFLRSRYNVESPLVTEHAGQHFRAPKRAEVSDAALREHLQTAPKAMEALNGTLVDGEGKLVFSTDADEPLSFARVLPDLCETLEVRFLMPRASGNRTGWDPLEIVAALPTRTGAKVYEARRMLPPLPDNAVGEIAKSKRDTFGTRVSQVLKGAAAEPGLLWPIYTHLGGLDNERAITLRDMEPYSSAQEEKILPAPYFEWEPLHELQNRLFNFSGDVDAKVRAWFARASVLYDYSLMFKTIAPHVTRPDGNTVEIASWTDAILNKTLPRSPSQLYGLTFYVDDPAVAQVRLDGKPLADVLRNPADETGRPSVTIAEADIRTILVGRADPVSNSQAQTDNGEWRWVPDAVEGLPHGRLQVAAKGVASLTMQLHGLAAEGAQILRLAARATPGAQFGLLLETKTGGRFFFGDEKLLPALDPGITASYHFKQHGNVVGQWRTLLAPFWDLSWAAGARPGGPLPSHPLQKLTILCGGDSGAALDIANIACLRPRARTLSRSADRRFCLGGCIAPFAPGQLVHVAPADGSGSQQDSAVDQRGYFCFTDLPGGIYRVWSTIDGTTVHDRRGPLVDVDGDVMNLLLQKR